MKSAEILNYMDRGFTLHSGLFGFWLIRPMDSRCINVHNGAAKSLVRKRLIRKQGTEYVRTSTTETP